MAVSQTPKSKNPSKSEDIEALKSDVATFASSLGLSSSSLPNSGFNDSDFRKSGPIKPPPKITKKPNPKSPVSQNPKFQNKTDKKPKPHNLNPLFDVPKKPESKSNGQDLPKLPLMKATSLSRQWYVDAAELESKVFGGDGAKTGERDVKEAMRLAEEKKHLAKRLMNQYVKDYESSRGQSGDMKLLAATQRSGTAKDKVAAFTCMVDDNQIANARSLDALLGLVTSKVGKRHALTGFDALMDLFLSRLLPDRKLKRLVQRPLSHLPESKDGYSLLLFWYWEEYLKQRYERFVVALEEASKDMLPILKDKALKTIYALLTKKSEQERRLLSALVNKLGDPEGKAGSDAVFHLLNLLREHPNMMAVVIEEVDSFLFRPHLGMRAKYYAINFLSQIRLRKGGYGPKVAKRLMDVYFALFKVLITGTERGQKLENKKQNEGKKGSVNLQNAKGETGVETNVEMDSRLLVALLTGVKRSFPYVASDEADDLVEVQTPMLFKLVHSKNFNVGVQSLMLLYDITSKNQIASDRFYRALYSKLPIPSVMNSSKSEMFLELLVKVMKNDINLKRVSAFSKRLLQGALQQPPQYACGCLLILSDVLKARPPLWNLMLQNESVDDDFEHFEDIKEESQMAVDATPSMLEKSVDLVSSRIDSNGVKTSSDPSESEDEEDPPASSSETEDNSEEENLIAVNGSTNVGEFEKVSDHDGGKEVKEFIKGNKGSPLPGGYNPQHREPLYCNADRTSWWELAVLALHVHPSVATMARTLLSGQHIIYNGNPLVDLSLSAFLDKFMEKKPKPNRRAEGIWHGGSQIAPARKLDTGHHLIGADILSLAEEDVPPEDLVFHRFYVNKASSSKKKKKKKPAEDEAAEELFDVADGDESDEGEIDDMLGSGTLPSENKGDYDYDDLDEVANEDDEDLLGDGSDGDVDSLATAGGGLSRSDDDDNNISEDGGDVDNEISGSGRKNKKRKVGGKSGASPFAALEDYDHLLNDDENVRRKKPKSQRKSH